MKGIFKLAGLLGGGGASLPMLGMAVVAGLSILGGAAIAGKRAWDNMKTELRNEGAKQCANAVRKEQFDQLTNENHRLVQLFSAEQTRVVQLQSEIKDIRKQSSESHKQIAEEMKAAKNARPAGTNCGIPDRAIDTINRPLTTDGGKK